MPLLTVNNGPEIGKKYVLGEGECILGRHPDCNIVIGIGAVSRQHAKVTRVGDDYYVEDLKSRNGTLRNNNLLQQREKLSHGDLVRVCDVEFTFELENAVPVISPTPAEARGSGKAVLLDDSPAAGNSTIMSKVDVSSHRIPLKSAGNAEVRLAALIEITQSLGRALSLDEVLPQVLNSLFKIFIQADRGFIVLKTDSGALVPRWTKVRRPDAEDTIRISRTIIHKVMDTKEAILSADASSDSQFAASQSIADFRIRSMMCAPLIDSDGKAFGALQIDTLDQRSRFQQEDLELLASIAAQSSISIDNAQLHDQALRRRELERELELAKEVQKGFLPIKPPAIPDYSFFHYYQPASHVGGDYFDYVQLPNGQLAIIVADVVGHGVAAALMMAKLSAEARYCLVSNPRPAEAVTHLNQRISGLTSDRFITMIMVVLNPATNEVIIVNAGHMAPIVRRANGQLEEPGHDAAGLPLGVVDDFEYEQATAQIEPGDLLAMYTDGINESSDPAGEMYGIDQIRRRIAGTLNTPELVGNDIVQDVRRFLAGRPQDDDMCLVCVGRQK